MEVVRSGVRWGRTDCPLRIGDFRLGPLLAGWLVAIVQVVKSVEIVAFVNSAHSSQKLFQVLRGKRWAGNGKQLTVNRVIRYSLCVIRYSRISELWLLSSRFCLLPAASCQPYFSMPHAPCSMLHALCPTFSSIDYDFRIHSLLCRMQAVFLTLCATEEIHTIIT